MITLISLNSSIDQVYIGEEFNPGSINRVNLAYRGAGGKTINVLKVLHTLNIPIQLIAFKAGITGNMLEKQISKLGIPTKWIEVVGESRFCTTVITEHKTFELLEHGHETTAMHIDELINEINLVQHETTYFVMTGSKPPKMTEEQYQMIINALQQTNIPFVLDTSGELLNIAYRANPFVLKPNEHEFRMLTDLQGETIAHYKEALLQLKDGPKNLFVSLGASGALLKSNGKIYYAFAPPIQAINSVGSGDSFLAGFLAGLYNNKSVEESLVMAMAAGMANAEEISIAQINVNRIDVLSQTINILIEEGIE